MAKKEAKKKVNKKALIVILLTLYLIIMAFYYAFSLPIKNIEIKGNTLLSDGQIISTAGIGDYPKIFMTSTKGIIDNLKSISLIKDCKVKKSLLGKITIEVNEGKVLFYNVLNNAYTIDNGTEFKTEEHIMGVPVLINYVPSDIYSNLIKKMANVDANILPLISEIEYSRNVKGDIVIDDKRFLLRMNDGNLVYINLANFDNINKYESIYASIEEGKKGVLNLDSINQNFLLESFESQEKESEGSDTNELPQ